MVFDRHTGSNSTRHPHRRKAWGGFSLTGAELTAVKKRPENLSPGAGCP